MSAICRPLRCCSWNVAGTPGSVKWAIRSAVGLLRSRSLKLLSYSDVRVRRVPVRWWTVWALPVRRSGGAVGIAGLGPASFRTVWGFEGACRLPSDTRCVPPTFEESPVSTDFATPKSGPICSIGRGGRSTGEKTCDPPTIAWGSPALSPHAALRLEVLDRPWGPIRSGFRGPYGAHFGELETPLRTPNPAESRRSWVVTCRAWWPMPHQDTRPCQPWHISMTTAASSTPTAEQSRPIK